MIGTLVALAAVAQAADCPHSVVRDTDAPAKGVTKVVIEVGAGDLRVEGGADRLRAHGKACADKAADLMELKAELRGDTWRVRTVAHPRAQNTRLDLIVEVPTAATVTIEDGSGDVNIRGVAGLEVEDGSGDISALKIAGPVSIEDGSGDIRIAEAGAVSVEDGSGSIEVSSVKSVKLEDGSGDIFVARVTGAVRIEEAGSGGVRVSDVEELVVRGASADDVVHSEVRGRASIE